MKGDFLRPADLTLKKAWLCVLDEMLLNLVGHNRQILNILCETEIYLAKSCGLSTEQAQVLDKMERMIMC